MSDVTNDDLLRWAKELRQKIDIDANSRHLFNHFYPRLFHYLTRKGFSQPQAEDLAQETLLRVFQEIQSFRGESSFSGWVFAIAANLIRNTHRDAASLKRNVAEVSLEWLSNEDHILEHLAGDDDSPEQTASQKEQTQALHLAISQLPTKRRRCVELQLRGRRLEEIAKLLQIDTGTVKAHLAQARAQLRQTLSRKSVSRDTPPTPSGVSQNEDTGRPRGVSPKEHLEKGDRR